MEPFSGFTPVDDLGHCIVNVIDSVAAYNRKTVQKRRKLRHILFPLLGTGQAMQNPEVIVPQLVDAAIRALETVDSKNSLKEVWFLARDELDFELLDRNLRIRDDKLEAC